MSFLVVGKGMFSKESLIDQLIKWGSNSPDEIMAQAARGRAVYGEYKILAVR